MGTYKNCEGITFTIGTDAYRLPSEPPFENPFAVHNLGCRIIERNGTPYLNLFVSLTNLTKRDLENPEVRFTLVNSEWEGFKEYAVVAGEVVEKLKNKIPKKYVVKALDTCRVGLVVKTEKDARQVYQQIRCIRIKIHFSRNTRLLRHARRMGLL